MSETFYLKVGDRNPSYSVILKDADKAAVNINTASAVRLHMKAPGASTAKVDAAMSNDDDGTVGNRGKASYAWAAADVDTAGTYYCEVEVEWADGTKETFPNSGHNIIKIEDELA